MIDLRGSERFNRSHAVHMTTKFAVKGQTSELRYTIQKPIPPVRVGPNEERRRR